jgi:hypothetical protein
MNNKRFDVKQRFVTAMTACKLEQFAYRQTWVTQWETSDSLINIGSNHARYL